MSLTAEQAIESAMTYLKDAELCLYDAVGNYDVHKEMEELKDMHYRLSKKLVKEVKNEIQDRTSFIS